MKRLLIQILTLFLTLTTFAEETPHSQVLVFRNTGEVNLLYADSIASITLSTTDEGVLCQVFATHGGSRLSVPVSEIDSVAFGSRNEVEIKKNVRVLTDGVDIPHITAYDGEVISYRATTPSSVLPAQGDLLFYERQTDLFPVGVCAKVTSVVRNGDTYRVAIETVDPAEIFDKLFFAGDSTDPEVARLSALASRASRAGVTIGAEVNTPNLKAFCGADVNFDNVVVNVLKHYYRVLCTVTPRTELEISLKLDNTEAFDQSYGERTYPFPVIGLVLQPSVDVAWFLNIEASLDFKYKLQRQFSVQYEWTRKDGLNTFTQPVVRSLDNEVNEASAEIMLDGKIFTGLEIKPKFGLIGDLAGAGVKLRVGPKFKAEIGAGVVQELSRKYSPELYAKGDLSVSLGLEYGTYLYHRNLALGEVEETPFGINGSQDFFTRTLHLFPQFKRTQAKLPAATVVATTTEVPEPVEYPLEVGFSIEEAVADNEPITSLSTVFQDEILDSCNDETIGFAESFNLAEIAGADAAKPEKLVVRPVFKYQGLTLNAAPAGITEGNPFHSVFSYGSADGRSYVGGAFDVRSVNSGGSCILVGNYFPRVKPNPVFSFNGGLGLVIGSLDGNPLIGTWKGEIGGEMVTLTFNSDLRGEWNDLSFNYTADRPQAGDVRLKFEDSSLAIKTFTVLDCTSDTLVIKRKGKSTVYTLKK